MVYQSKKSLTSPFNRSRDSNFILCHLRLPRDLPTLYIVGDSESCNFSETLITFTLHFHAAYNYRLLQRLSGLLNFIYVFLIVKNQKTLFVKHPDQHTEVSKTPPTTHYYISHPTTVLMLYPKIFSYYILHKHPQISHLQCKHTG